MDLYMNNIDGKLYVSHNNLWFKVDVIFSLDGKDEVVVNKYMEENNNSSVLIVTGDIIVLCDKNDKGKKAV